MPGPRKITLAQAKRQRDFMLTLYCWNPAICHHKGEMRVDDAIARWGPDCRLDRVPARCTKCGSRKYVDVRSRPPSREGGSALAVRLS